MDLEGHARFLVSGNQRSRDRDYLKSHLLRKVTEGNDGARYTFDPTGWSLLEVCFVHQTQFLLFVSR